VFKIDLNLTGSTLVRAHVAQGLVGGKVQNEFSIGLDKIKQNTKKLALAQQLKYGDIFSVSTLTSKFGGQPKHFH
jgi:hypothetical protein